MDMFVDAWFPGFQIKRKISKMQTFFVGILIALPYPQNKQN